MLKEQHGQCLQNMIRMQWKNISAAVSLMLIRWPRRFAEKDKSFDTCCLLFILFSHLSPIAFNSYNQYSFTNIDYMYILYICAYVLLLSIH